MLLKQSQTLGHLVETVFFDSSGQKIDDPQPDNLLTAMFERDTNIWTAFNGTFLRRNYF